MVIKKAQTIFYCSLIFLVGKYTFFKKYYMITCLWVKIAKKVIGSRILMCEIDFFRPCKWGTFLDLPCTSMEAIAWFTSTVVWRGELLQLTGKMPHYQFLKNAYPAHNFATSCLKRWSSLRQSCGSELVHFAVHSKAAVLLFSVLFGGCLLGGNSSGKAWTSATQL